MSCDNCGMPAQGSLCATCRTMKAQEERDTPAEYMARQQAMEDDEEDEGA